MTRPTRWSRGSRGNGGTVTRRRGGVQRGVVLVPLALRAAPVSVVSLVHHGHVGGRPERRALARGAPPRVDPRDRVRARLLARLRGARRVVQRRRPVPARLSRPHSARRRRPHRDLRALHRWRLPARHLRSHGAVADQREAGRLSGYAARRRHLRDRVDAVRGADPRRHSLARRHRRDGVARRGAAGRLLGGPGVAVPALGHRAGIVLEVLQALSAVHSDRRARRGRPARRRRRARHHQQVHLVERVADLADSRVAAEAAVTAVAWRFTSAFLGPPLDRSTVLNVAARAEGHPDNVAAALLGGLTVSAGGGDGAIAVALPVPSDLHWVTLIPEITSATSEARAVLPSSVPREDAVFNVLRVALLLAALQTRRVDVLGTALDDRLHQPYRVRLFPWLPSVADAARKAGALGCVLSGAGPALLAVVAGTEGEASAVARAMEEALARAGITGAANALAVDREGAVSVKLGGPP